MNALGLFSNGMQADKIVSVPLINPAEPIPATARLIMSIFDDTETAHRSEPNSNTAKKQRKVILAEKLEYTFPASGCREALKSIGKGQSVTALQATEGWGRLTRPADRNFHTSPHQRESGNAS
jgi:hypothetical protein